MSIDLQPSLKIEVVSGLRLDFHPEKQDRLSILMSVLGHRLFDTHVKLL